MSKKTLNTANLEALGAAKLAALLMEVSTGSADIKRRLRLELSHNLGASELAHEVRKRLASLRKSKSYVSWRKRRALVKDLQTQRAMITDKIAPDDPAEAFALLWQFMEIAPSVFDRVDDSKGEVGDVFASAIPHFEQIAPRAGFEPTGLADQIWVALQSNTHNIWGGIIAALAPTLGDKGIARLKAHVTDFAAAPQHDDSDDHAALLFLRELRGGRDYVAERNARFVKACLQDIAMATGDIQGYIAQFTQADLQDPKVAAEVATLLLSQGQAADAFDILQNAHPPTYAAVQDVWDDAHIAALTALGRDDDVQAYHLGCFHQRLNVPHLRAYLKRLPDFDDVEAEDAAKAYALDFPDFGSALAFCITWPNLHGAAQLVVTRAAEIDGEHASLLIPAAEALRDRYPLAATVLYRAMISFALHDGRTSRYGAAADQLLDCAALAQDINDYAGFAAHERFVETLRETYAHKASFWAKLEV